jgi:hypothetical protein
LRRSGSIRSNCSAGPRSRISAVQTRNAAATAPGLRAQARPPGTEFLDAETGRQKSSTNARTPTETKIQELSTRKSAQKRPIWRRVGNAWFARTGWWCAQSDTNRSPTCNSLLTGKLTGNFAFLGPQKPISLHETTVLQRLFTKFPTQINRENILKNREISGKNREIW